MTSEELRTELANFQNKMKDHAEFICFLKPKDRREEIVAIHGNGGNLAAAIAIARIQEKDVRDILQTANMAYEKFKDKV